MTTNVGLLGALSCLVGRHARSRDQAKALPEGWVSRCARCAIPMAKAHGGGKWEVVKMPKRGDGVLYEALAQQAVMDAILRSRKTGHRKDDTPPPPALAKPKRKRRKKGDTAEAEGVAVVDEAS